MKIIRELYAYREMISSLVKKDLRGRYKGSVLGFLWTFINPICQIIIYTMVFSVIMDSGIDNFYLFLIVGLIPWIFFSSSINGGAVSIIIQQDLVKKIYFPRKVLPISYVTSSFVNMLFSFVIIFAVLFVSGFGVNIFALVFLPLVMIIEYILALGIALICAACTVFFRDLEHILGIITMAWMYLTPIMYSVDMIPKKILPIFNLNPMTPVITAYRDILYFKNIPNIETLIQALCAGLAIFFLGIFIFSKLQRNFAEEL